MRVRHRDRGKSAAGGPGRKMRVPFANNAAAAFPEPPRSKAVVLVSVSGGWHLQHVRISGLYHPGAMSPDPRSRRRQSARHKPTAPQVRTRPSSDDAHEVVFFRRHSDDDPGQAVPARQFLNASPVKVRATMRAVLAQVAAAPPKRFAGGGYWEAMKGDIRDGSRSASMAPSVITTGCSAAWTTMPRTG